MGVIFRSISLFTDFNIISFVQLRTEITITTKELTNFLKMSIWGTILQYYKNKLKLYLPNHNGFSSLDNIEALFKSFSIEILEKIRLLVLFGLVHLFTSLKTLNEFENRK